MAEAIMPPPAHRKLRLAPFALESGGAMHEQGGAIDASFSKAS
jgi:hypothetical protein